MMRPEGEAGWMQQIERAGWRELIKEGYDEED